jgi:L-ascorbate metabolism protein UlaG (beta-lactamase superfamily)
MTSNGRREKNPYYDGSRSDHFDGVRFFNPGGVEPLGLVALLKWQWREKRARWPSAYPSPFVGAKPAARIEGDGLRVTMVGHASLLIQTQGQNILTDPVFSTRASPLTFAGPKRHNPPGVRIDDLPKIDLVLVTHNHYDHLDIASLKTIVAAHHPQIITPLGNDAIIRKSIPNARIIATDWGDQTDFGPFTIHTEPCHHWSARGMGDRRMALWAAFVISTPSGAIYHIGDTGFHHGINYRAAAEKHGGFRLAILPIGAYEPRWFMKGQHQNPAEAVEGMRLARAQYAVGHHWGTFQLTNEAVEAPLQALSDALDAAGVEGKRFRALRAGESADIPEK